MLTKWLQRFRRKGKKKLPSKTDRTARLAKYSKVRIIAFRKGISLDDDVLDGMSLLLLDQIIEQGFITDVQLTTMMGIDHIPENEPNTHGVGDAEVTHHLEEEQWREDALKAVEEYQLDQEISQVTKDHIDEEKFRESVVDFTLEKEYQPPQPIIREVENTSSYSDYNNESNYNKSSTGWGSSGGWGGNDDSPTESVSYDSNDD